MAADPQTLEQGQLVSAPIVIDGEEEDGAWGGVVLVQLRLVDGEWYYAELCVWDLCFREGLRDQALPFVVSEGVRLGKIAFGVGRL